MTKLKVDGISCINCTKRIEKALSAENIDFTVSLEEKTVTTSDNEVKKVQEILDSLGFDSVKEND